MTKKRIINFAGHKPAPGREDEFIEFYVKKHVPDLAKRKELKKVKCYRLKDTQEISVDKPKTEYPTFLAIHEFENWEDFKTYDSSPEKFSAGGGEAKKVVAETGDELMWRVQYELISTWER